MRGWCVFTHDMVTHLRTIAATLTASHTGSGRRRLDALTSLRFFAAAMIVLQHVRAMTGHIGSWADTFPWAHGVSFFFVLSGFILTYTYPAFETSDAVVRFWVARFARVWPVHAVTAVIALTVWAPPAVSNELGAVAVVAANFLLVQAWVPISSVGYSLNGASWSVSAEVFFYLMFPLLVFDWRRTWHRKLGLSLLLLVAVVSCGNATRGLQVLSDREATTHAFAYLNPLARLFEFTLGMASYILWRRLDGWKAWTPAVATAAEAGAVALTVCWMWNRPVLALVQTLGGPTGVEWARYAGASAAFALLIPVIAAGRGAISWGLAFPGLVLLGESSYSLYLSHSMVLSLVDHLLPGALAGINLSGWALLWLLLIGVALLSWAFVELPARRWILHAWDTRTADSVSVARPTHGEPSRSSA